MIKLRGKERGEIIKKNVKEKGKKYDKNGNWI